jgi:hypothetical protein
MPEMGSCSLTIPVYIFKPQLGKTLAINIAIVNVASEQWATLTNLNILLINIGYCSGSGKIGCYQFD